MPSSPSKSTPKPARPTVQFRIRVTQGDEVAIGPGKIALLEAIQAQGSITEAAKHIGMSYRRAWLLLDEINRLLRKPVTQSSQGGSRGGGSQLTPEGETLIRVYREIELQAEASCTEQLKQLIKMVASP